MLQESRLRANLCVAVVACCARAASGHAATAPPSSAMNSRRLMPNMGLPPKGAAADHTS